MGETGKQLKCKNCGGVLEFDPESQRMKCPYCGTEEEVTASDTDGNVGKNGTEMEDENRGDFKVITCESCGAELLTDEYTTATFCSYCGSPTLVESRLTDEQMPDGVLPFWINREKALEAYRGWTKKGFLTPKVFKSAAVMEKISGIYVPFWLYDYETDLHAQGECVRTRFSSDSENDYTHRDYFYVCRDIEARFEKVPADASEKMEDGMMDKLEPFQYEDLRPFSMKYLSGYLSERYNMAAAALEDRVEDRVSNYMEEILDKEVMGYSERHLIKDVKSHLQKAEYVLLPVWLLNYRYNGKNYTFAMNGQTGKIVADRPISKGKATGVFFRDIYRDVSVDYDHRRADWMKMLHKRFLALLLLVSFLILPGFTYQNDKQRIYDNAGLFTEEERQQLESIYCEYSLEDEMDYILLTSDSPEVDDSREYAKAFYLENGFGYNKEGGDGNLLFIDMANRRVEMIDKGKCVDYIRDEEVEEILDEVTPHLSDGNYIEAAQSYADYTHSAFVTAYASVNENNGMMRYVIYGILALVVAGIVTGGLVMGNRSRMTADCYTYGKEIRVNPHTRQDRYIRTVTTATPKPKHDSDGGGGSFDSSGFGGGGRDF